jgi:hypothetical protein
MSIDPNDNSSRSAPFDPYGRRERDLDALCVERKNMLTDIDALLVEKSERAGNDPKTVMLQAQRAYLLSQIGDAAAAQAYNLAKLAYETSQRAKPFLEKAREKMGSERVTALNNRIQAHDIQVSDKQHRWIHYDGVKKGLNQYINTDLKKQFGLKSNPSGPSTS